MKNRSGEKIKLASIDELLGVVNEESAMEIEISKIHPFNVLQYNPTSNSKIRAPQKQEMVAFKHQLEQTGLEVPVPVCQCRQGKR